MKRMSYIALILALCGCAGTPYKSGMISQPDKGKARVVIYNENAINGMVGMTMFLNESRCSLLANGFITESVPPGKVVINIGNDAFSAQVRAGQTYYFRLNRVVDRGAALASGAFGLIGAGIYAATETEHTPDWTFSAMPKDKAQRDLSSKNLSEGCR